MPSFLKQLTLKSALLIGTSLVLLAAGTATIVNKKTTNTVESPAVAKVGFIASSNSLRFSEAVVLQNSSLEAAGEQPLSLATADFDLDGVADLVSGIGFASSGYIKFYHGQSEAIYPTKKTDPLLLPFVATDKRLVVNDAPDFIVAGDFNADGKADLIVAARGQQRIWLHAGNGNGTFAEAVSRDVGGAITALATGEVNRVDGLDDLAIAVTNGRASKVLVFAGRTGMWEAEAKTVAISAPAKALALGHLTGDRYSDLVIGAGKELIVAEGRAGALSITRRQQTGLIESLTIGKFTRQNQNQIALLLNNGAVYVAQENVAQLKRRSSNRQSSENWKATLLTSAETNNESLTSAQLIRARVTASPNDDLLLLKSNSFRVITNKNSPEVIAAQIENNADLVAALPMRLGHSALNGLVFLSANQSEPLIATPEVAMTFTVNSIADLPDLNPGDGVCNASAAAAICTLRAAIMEANANVGADTILFNIGAGTQTIIVDSALPIITEAVTIDGVPQGAAPATQQIVITAGTNLVFSNPGLRITSGSSRVRGLDFINFSTNGAINLTGGGDNIIDGNVIFGTGITGESGIYITNSADNLIGGTTAAARNVISSNQFAGVYLSGTASQDNVIIGNYIGTDVSGADSSGNGIGIYIRLADNNFIGGDGIGEGNVISGNDTVGIWISGLPVPSTFLSPNKDAADGTLIQGNYIGVDASGTGALGNGNGESLYLDGIFIEVANDTTIGGSTANAGNVIAYNSGNGVSISPAITQAGVTTPAGTGNEIFGNEIYENSGLGIDLGADGVTDNDPGDADTGANNLQNAPIITSAVNRNSGTTISGTLNSTPNQTFTIDFYENVDCDPTDYGEGEIYLTKLFVTTDATGNVAFNFTWLSPPLPRIPNGHFITATASDAAGNTSEFSVCTIVRDALSDLGVTVAASPNPVSVGSNLTYTTTVTNSGQFLDGATNVQVTNTITIPGGQYTVVSATTPKPGGICSGTGPVTCMLGRMDPGTSTTVVVVVAPTIPISATPPLSVTATNTVGVSSDEVDPIATNNAASSPATVQASSDLAVTQSVTPNPVPSGTGVSYTVTVTNNGPSATTFVSGQITPPLALINVSCTAPAGWSCNRDGNPFFIGTSVFAPGTAVFTISGTLACLEQNATLTSTATISSQATDPITANNSSTINSTGLAGSAIGTVAFDAGGTPVLGPVAAGSTATPPSATFTLTNTGCLPMILGNAFFERVNQTSLSGVDDSRYYSLRLVPATGAEIPLNPTPQADRNAPQPIPVNRTIQSGQQLRFRVIFNPPIPFFAGAFARADLGIFASQVLPSLFDSRVRFNFVSGSIPISPGFEATGDPGTALATFAARVSPAVQIIPRDGNAVGNPATTPMVEMTTIRDDFRVRVSMYDSNKNVTRISYQFFDTYRQPASGILTVDVTSILSSSALLPGQCFTLQQDFSGAAGRPDVTYVRISVTDADGTTVNAASSPFIAFATGISPESAPAQDIIYLPSVRLNQFGVNFSQRLIQMEPNREFKAKREN